MARHFLFAACLISALVVPTGARSAFDAAADFSPTSNPNGVWSYGWTQTLRSSFTLDAIHENKAGLDYWEGSIANVAFPGSFADIFHANTIASFGSFSVAPGQLGFHPGPGGEYSVLRWTAPRNDEVSIASIFSGLDFDGPTSTDVHVFHNHAFLFDSVVEGFGSSSAKTFNSVLTVARGDTIDFAVGFGRNGTFRFDSTGLSATIASVPEPATLALLGVGILGLVGYRLTTAKKVL